MKLGCVLLVPGLLFAQSQAAQDKCRIEGKVLNSVTGQPLRKVRVNLNGIRTAMAAQARAQMQALAATGQPIQPPSMLQLSASTDASGSFAFNSLDAGSYSLSAQHERFQSPGALSRPQTVTLSPGDAKADLVIRLAPLGVVSGRVLDEDGDPIRRVQVAAMAYQYSPNGRQLSQRAGSSTDDHGDFRIFDLPPAKYYLRASPTQVQNSSSVSDDQPLMAAFYPGVIDSTAASPVEVHPGDDLRNIDLTLRHVRGAAIRGKIVKPPGLPATASTFATLLQVSSEGLTGFSRSASSDAQGNFQIRGLAPGSYVLMAQSMVAQQRYSARFPVQLGQADVDGIELRPAPPMEVNGVVRVEGAPTARLSMARVNLQGQSAGFSSGASTTVKDDGTFTLKSVEAGPYKVTATLPVLPNTGANTGPPVRLYLKSVRCGNSEVAATGVDFSSGAACELAITFSASGGKIDGKVEQQDAAGPTDALVVTLIPDGAPRDSSRVQLIGVRPTGAFQFTGIAPGSYKLFAWEQRSVEIAAVEYDPEFLKPYESQGQSVLIVENDSQSVSLKVVKTAKEQ